MNAATQLIPWSHYCPTTTSCLAVGYYQDVNTNVDAFVSVGTMSATTWSWTTSTLAPSSALIPASSAQPFFVPKSIVCPSATSCLIAGSYQDISHNLDGFVAVGTLSAGAWTWSMSTLSTAGLSPAAKAASYVEALAMSCASLQRCVLTGQYSDNNAPSGFDGFVDIGTFSAGAWTWSMSTLSTAALSPQSSLVPNVLSSSISCPTATTCLTTGRYGDTSGNTEGFIAFGTLTAGNWTWTLSTLPLSGLSPASATSPTVWPSAISCTSVTNCVTSGSYMETGSNFDGYIAVGTPVAGKWTWVVQTVSTAGLSPVAGTTPNVHVNAISCAGVSSCVATGYYRDTYGFTDGFFDVGTLNGSTWSWVTTMIPASGLSPAANTSTNIEPNWIFCASPAVCVDSGFYLDNLGNLQGFVSVLGHLANATPPVISNLPSGATAGSSFTATVTTTGDGAVSLVSSTTAVCTVLGLTVTELAPGTCSLTAVVADGVAYIGVTGTPQAFVVAPGHLAQLALSISNRKVELSLHATALVTTRGGSGTGAVTLHLVSGKCLLRAKRLSVTSPHACTVRATKAHDATHRSVTSKAVTFYFGFTAQRALILTVSSVHATHGAHVRLSTTGGTGTGAVVYSVTGAHCSLHGSSVTATRAGLCIVHATKNWSATYLPATAKFLKVTFS